MKGVIEDKRPILNKRKPDMPLLLLIFFVAIALIINEISLMIPAFIVGYIIGRENHEK